MIVEKKEVRIVPDSVSRLINGTGENGQPGVAEIHAGLSPEDVSAIQDGEAKLVAAIVENGIMIIEEPPIQPPIYDVDEPHVDDGTPTVEIPESVGTGGTSDGISPIGGVSPIAGDNHLIGNPIPTKDPISIDDTTSSSGIDSYIPPRDSKPSENKDDDNRRTILGIPILKKILGIGAALGLSLLLSQCNGLNIPQVGNPFVDVHEEHHIEHSNVYQVSEIADLYFESDEYLRGSQVRSPGEFIDELRNAGWAENLGREEGRAEYDARDGEDRARDEQFIQDINKRFEEQTQIIQDNRAIIENPNSTPQQVTQAIEAIRGAKSTQRALYDEFTPLFERYFDEAVSAVENPADDRTEAEVDEYAGIYAQYQDGRENLTRDIDKVSGIIETYLHPERYEDEFFEETAEQQYDAEDKGDVVNTLEALGPFGHREVVESTVTSELDADPNTAGQVHEGLIDVTQAREVTVTETRYGLSAIFHKIGDFFAELGQKLFHSHDVEVDNNDELSQAQQNSSTLKRVDIDDEER